MIEEEKTKSEIAKREEEILEFWEANRIFEKSLEKSAPKGEFVFYEGPPTANGKPGIHHIEARAFKDLIPRYKTMQGFHVRRKGGWDTHGLPVELQVEKQLGLKSKKEVEAYGIEKFNQKCKESVWEYLDVWNKFTKRIGYWVDEKNPYITYQSSYIEGVWNVLKKVHERNLLYKDYKVVPWCPRCGTALSSHELAQGYQDDKDLSVTVKFKLLPNQKFGENEEFTTGDNVYVLAWTTTPWTLPGNTGLLVGKDISYSAIKVVGKEDLFILATNLLENNFGLENINIIHTFKGNGLVGLKYEPLYLHLRNKFRDQNPEGFEKTYQIYLADFVTIEDGTGIVHTAVMYGQEDFELATKIGLPKYHLVDEKGNFIEEMDFLSGRFVKDEGTAVEIIKDLAQKGLLFKKEKYEHSYPHCWRCKTPLIYYARDSWYIRMSSLREELSKENEKINWVPAHIQEGRFGEWLLDLKDWAISRERFWGTPLPVWQNPDGQVRVVGSIAELKKLARRSGNQYFAMRHGEAEQNIQDIINSEVQNVFHLTEEGRRQAGIAASDLKAKKIDLIITSPFTRCKETAEIVRQALGLPETAVLEEARLGEFKKGPGFEGRPWPEYWALFQSVRDKFEKSPDGGENLFDLNKRVGDVLYELEKQYSNKRILLVSHEGPIEAMQMVGRGATLDESVVLKEQKTYWCNFAEFTEIDFTPLPHNDHYELDLHKPFIDEFEIQDESGQKLTRVKEVLDVWLDSGAMPFAQDGISNDSKLFYPADFISEAIDQTRGWFYTLHAVGVLMGRGQAYKNVICLGHILDSEGKKMSKSLGNIIDPWLMMDKYGVDALRFWMYTVNQPGDSKNFDERTVDEIVKKVFNPITNIISFYEMYGGGAERAVAGQKNILDIWITARLQALVLQGTADLDDYRVFEAARAVRDFVNDFSSWYLRRSRDRFKSSDLVDRAEALSTTKFVLLNLAKYLAPFTPFFAEHLYGRVRMADQPESVHISLWPDLGSADQKILQKMKETRELVSSALEKRMAAGLKVRQPLAKLKVKKENLKGEPAYLELVKDEVNVKEIEFDNSLNEEVWLDTIITEELKAEGQVREVVRHIQDLRKAADLLPSQPITVAIETDQVGNEFIQKYSSNISKPTNIQDFVFEQNGGSKVIIENLNLKIQIK